MPITALTGSRVRERRLALGLQQGRVAKDVGISASYLNLIEHDRRAVGGALLGRLAEVLGTEVAALEGAAEGEMVAALGVAGGGLGEAGAFLARFPGWASVLFAQLRRAEALQELVSALNDRMSHDPHVSAAVHEVLSGVTAVQATATILAEAEELEPAVRRRFQGNLVQASGQLARGAEALVGFLAATDVQGVLSPQDEVEAWWAGHDWQVGEDFGGLSGAALVIARAWVGQAVQDQAAMPEGEVVDAGLDPVRLAALCGVDVIAACRRIALRAGSGVGLVVCDGAGALIFRKPVPGFGLPRQGAACALWPLFAALARPLQGVEVVGEMPSSPAQRFTLRAFCQPVAAATFGGPDLRQAAMLIMPGGGGAAVPMGPTCRICPRGACAGRREPSLLTGVV